MEKIFTKISRPSEFAIFCGAGISKNSGLPLANQLKECVLKRFFLDKKDIPELMRSDLPFEGFMEIIRNKVDISKILDIFALGTPSTNHMFLAKLAKYGLLKTIYTTNFDLLIEKALEREGLHKEKDFRVYSSEEDFSTLYQNINKISIIKIHGSIDNKDSIRTTLKAVASKSLSDERIPAINHMLLINGNTGCKTLVILGYSCSDTFDIVPQIRNLKKNLKHMILVVHSKEEAIEDIRKSNDAYPFKNYSGKCIKTDTDRFIELWWKHLSTKIGKYESESYEINWRKNISEWADNLKKCKGLNILGSLFNSISSFDKAIEYFNKSLEIAHKTGDKSGEIECCKGLGDVYQNLGDDTKRIENYERVIKLTNDIAKVGYIRKEGQLVDIHEDERTSEILHNLKQCSQMMNEYKESIKYDNNEETYNKAIKQLGVLLELVKKSGYKSEEAACYISLGTNYYMLKNYKRAIECWEIGREIAIEVGAKYIESDSCECLSRAYEGIGETEKAREYLDKAEKINTELGVDKTLRIV